MKQQKSKRQTRNKKAARQAAPQSAKPEMVSRRSFLSLMRNWGLFAAVGVGGGWYLVDEVLATIGEQDLTRIGNGTPTVVQIHDPQSHESLQRR